MTNRQEKIDFIGGKLFYYNPNDKAWELCRLNNGVTEVIFTLKGSHKEPPYINFETGEIKDHTGKIVFNFKEQ